MTRQKRGTSCNKFDITVLNRMSQGNSWQELLNISECKDQLIEMIKQYILEFGSRILPRFIPFIITSRQK